MFQRFILGILFASKKEAISYYTRLAVSHQKKLNSKEALSKFFSRFQDIRRMHCHSFRQKFLERRKLSFGSHLSGYIKPFRKNPQPKEILFIWKIG